jgi:hypothetical protein
MSDAESHPMRNIVASTPTITLRLTVFTPIAFGKLYRHSLDIWRHCAALNIRYHHDIGHAVHGTILEPVTEPHREGIKANVVRQRLLDWW